jgi:hypothetical protein
MRVGALLAAGVLVLAGCASAPRGAAALPDEAREQPQRYVVVTVRNAPAAPEPIAASTPRGYAGYRPYRAGAAAVDALRRVAGRHDLREVAAWPIEPLRVHCVVYALPAQAERERVLDALRREPAVESAQALMHFELQRSFDDPYAGLQRNLLDMDVVAAQRWSRGDGVRIAVVDTGVDTAHPDFGGRLIGVRDFVADGSRVDRERHGTAVAGVIAAVPDNGIGVAGIAPQASVLPLRACWASGDGGGRCDSFTLAQALAAAIEARAEVVNLSLGGPADPLLQRLVERALRRGALVVGALPASRRREGFPTGIDGIVVAGVAGAGSTPGTLPAPGIDVYTLQPQARYDAVSGSSVAAAGVSAVAALLLARQPGLSARDVAALLERSVRALTRTSDGVASINACAALRELDGGCRSDAGPADYARSTPSDAR